MIDHVSLGTVKFDEAVQFYSDCFLTLGYRPEHRTAVEAAFGTQGKWTFWLYPVAAEPVVATRCHVAVMAETQDKVVAFHQAALRCGAATVRAPGARPDISPDYFGTVIRDLDGHTIEVVHWSM